MFTWGKNKKSQFRLFASTLLLSFSPLGLQATPANAQSDWIDENVDEIRLNNSRFPSLSQPKEPVVKNLPSEEHEESSPVLSVGVRKREPLTGGVSTQRHTGNQAGRGLDGLARQFLEQAPFLDRPESTSVPPGQFKAFLEKNYPGETANLKKSAVIEVKGQWDDCSHPLRSFGLAHTRISAPKLVDTDLSATHILLINCGSQLDSPAIDKIREFVKSGGFLLTTDWALDSCLQKAFPGFVEWNNDYTDDSVVDAVVVDRDPLLLKGVPRVGHWKLEAKSQTVRVIRPNEVQVLVRSRALARQESSGLGILALTFGYGHGQVLHLVGHFDNNSTSAFTNSLPDPAPIINISLRQAIAANFIMASLNQSKE